MTLLTVKGDRVRTYETNKLKEMAVIIEDDDPDTYYVFDTQLDWEKKEVSIILAERAKYRRWNK